MTSLSMSLTTHTWPVWFPMVNAPPTFPLMISNVTRPRSPESMSVAPTWRREGEGGGWWERVHGGCVGNRPGKGRDSGEGEM